MEILSQTVTAANTKELEITYNAEEFEAAVAETAKKKSGKIQIPGFRKGKAPRKMIEKLYGESFFFEDTAEELYHKTIIELSKTSDFDIVSVENVNVESINKESGIKYKITLILRPDFDVAGYLGLEVEAPGYSATDERVEAELQRSRGQLARITTVEGRPAGDGDQVDIDFEGFVDDVAFQGGQADNHVLTLGSGQFIPGFEAQIVGHTVGEEFDVTVTFPEEYHAEELAGKEAVFKVKLNEIKERVLPPLDDELAKDKGFDTLDEYRDDIRADLAKKFEDRKKVSSENAIAEALIAKTADQSVPEVMFEDRTNDLISEYEYNLQSYDSHLTLDTYLLYQNQSKEEFTAAMRSRAEKQVRFRLILDKVSRLENIELTDDEINKSYEEIAKTHKTSLDKVRRAVPQSQVEGDLKAEKALEIIRNSAKITYVEATDDKGEND
ncbi:MAG: trigger factor [Oscillospiraceae bacterium]|jgi:trigger factor|nr:trigger factor [Oscillospiraceae bacterium]